MTTLVRHLSYKFGDEPPDPAQLIARVTEQSMNFWNSSVKKTIATSSNDSPMFSRTERFPPVTKHKLVKFGAQAKRRSGFPIKEHYLILLISPNEQYLIIKSYSVLKSRFIKKCKDFCQTICYEKFRKTA